MAESVTLTKSAGGDYQLVITKTGVDTKTIQFPAADYSTNAVGVKLNARAKDIILMDKYYAPSLWTVGVATGYTTNKQVTDAITALETT